MSTTSDKASRPIGVFDSGLGGLTVVRRIIERLPGEEIVYLGDSARVPYGIKSPETVRRFAAEDMAFLMRFDPKLIVVACNTASAVATDSLRAASPVPVVGVVVPAAAAAVAQGGDGPIGVIGTEGTIASGAYQRAIAERNAGVQVLAAAAPLLVPIVEEGRAQDDPIVLHVLGDYLHDMQRARPTVLVLGCTHYPLLARAIGKLMGPDTVLLDTGAAAAEVVGEILARDGLAATGPNGPRRFFSTDNAERFARLARRFLGSDVSEVTQVGADELVEPDRRLS